MRIKEQETRLNLHEHDDDDDDDDGVITTIGLKKFNKYVDSNGIWRGILQLTSVPVLSHVVVAFFSAIVVLNTDVQLLGCASVAFSKRCVHRRWLFLLFSFLHAWAPVNAGRLSVINL